MPANCRIKGTQKDYEVHVKMTIKWMENPGIDPGTSHMLSERSTTWANSPAWWSEVVKQSEVWSDC